MRRRLYALALVAWTLFVWTTRLGTIWRDDALDAGEKVGRTGLAASFTVLALAVAAALWRRSASATRVTVGLLAGWSVAVWVVRDARIVAADHDLGFTIVHLALGAVSVTLAALAWREDRRAGGADRAAGTTARAVPAGRGR